MFFYFVSRKWYFLALEIIQDVVLKLKSRKLLAGSKFANTVRANAAARHRYSVPGYVVQQGQTSVLP